MNRPKIIERPKLARTQSMEEIMQKVKEIPSKEISFVILNIPRETLAELEEKAQEVYSNRKYCKLLGIPYENRTILDRNRALYYCAVRY